MDNNSRNFMVPNKKLTLMDCNKIISDLQNLQDFLKAQSGSNATNSYTASLVNNINAQIESIRKDASSTNCGCAVSSSNPNAVAAIEAAKPKTPVFFNPNTVKVINGNVN